MTFTRRQTIGLALAACLPATAQAAAVAWPARTELLDGQVLDAQAWQGQPLLVVFWATHCPFCLRHNAKLHQLLQISPDLRVLAVAQDRDPAVVRRYMARHGYHFPVTLDARAWQAALPVKRVLPTTVPIDRAGRVGLVMPGEMFEEDLAELARWTQS
jgi:thiol-disulfide isomerase/thioredoxin